MKTYIFKKLTNLSNFVKKMLTKLTLKITLISVAIVTSFIFLWNNFKVNSPTRVNGANNIGNAKNKKTKLSTDAAKKIVLNAKPYEITEFKINNQDDTKNFYSAEQQAELLFDSITNAINKNQTLKYGILYSANCEQSKKIIEFYQNNKDTEKLLINGANQASVFKILLQKINQYQYKDNIRVIPIATCKQSGGKDAATIDDAKRDLTNLAQYFNKGWIILGLQNRFDDKFAIGGGVSQGNSWESNAGKFIHKTLNALTAKNKSISYIRFWTLLMKNNTPHYYHIKYKGNKSNISYLSSKVNEHSNSFEETVKLVNKNLPNFTNKKYFKTSLSINMLKDHKHTYYRDMLTFNNFKDKNKLPEHKLTRIFYTKFELQSNKKNHFMLNKRVFKSNQNNILHTELSNKKLNKQNYHLEKAVSTLF